VSGRHWVVLWGISPLPHGMAVGRLFEVGPGSPQGVEGEMEEGRESDGAREVVHCLAALQSQAKRLEHSMGKHSVCGVLSGTLGNMVAAVRKSLRS
jgi:hypothetical protein